MTTNDIMQDVHKAIIAKVKDKCSVEGNNQLAIDIANDVLEYAKALTGAFANDGKIDADEEAKLNALFSQIITKRVPAVSGTTVSLAWEGVKVWPFSGMWGGVKSYLNKWFDLGL